MKVLFYIDIMNQGGAARMISLIANKLAERNHQVAIATNIHKEIVYHIDERVSVLSLYPQDAYEKSRLHRLIGVFKLARRAAKQYRPDVIVTTIPSVSFFVKLATMGMRIPTVFCDVTSYARKDSPFVHFVRYHFYKLADAVTIETENDRRLLGKRLPQKVVINDPLSFDIYRGPENREKFILAVGPTNEWEIKGFDMLLHAWGNIAKKYPDWKLCIAGSKYPEPLKFLQSIIDKYDISSQVDFLGFQRDIAAIMRRASVFALASRIEGFSLSIIESISQGCPCVCFRTVGVMTEVTENGTGAIIVEDGDVQDYSKQLDRLLSDPSLREQLSKDGRNFVSKYEIGKITSEWENLFNVIVRRK